MNPLYRHSFGVHIKNPIFCQNSPPIFQKLAQIILLHFPLKKIPQQLLPIVFIIKIHILKQNAYMIDQIF